MTNNFYKNHFCKIQKYERGGWLKVKIHIFSYGDNSQTVGLRQMKFGAVKA
jgi:hypothetical protein